MTKILIVDDRPENRLRLRQLLESKSYQVVEAADAAQALTSVQREHPDMVLLESIVAGSESAEVIDALRGHSAAATLPLMTLATRYLDQIDPASDTERGVERLTAPISDSELLARVRVALRTSQVQAQLQRRNEQLSALVHVMDAANSTLDLHELAQRVIERTLIVTSMVSASIWLRDRDQLVCLAHYPPQRNAAVQGERRPIQPDTPLGRVLGSGRPEFAGDAAPADAANQPAAVLPLLARDKLIGALAFRVRAGEIIPPDERAVLSAIATHVAVAIQHAQLYQRAERQRQQLQEIDQQKDEFISITSHELKNPMASIKGYADLMLRRIAKNPDDPNRKGLEIISQQVSRMTTLLDQLLDVSRIGMDRLQLERRRADLVAIVRRCVDEMRGTTDQHELRLEVRDAPLIGNFDEARISQAIGNLLSNAIKYSPRGGPIEVRVERSAHTSRAEAIVVVSDQGIGIPQADRERLFERFFRASNAGSSFAGMGLGLFITRGLVRQHGGRIAVESEEGQGTTFTIALPLERSGA